MPQLNTGRAATDDDLLFKVNSDSELKDGAYSPCEAIS